MRRFELPAGLRCGPALAPDRPLGRFAVSFEPDPEAARRALDRWGWAYFSRVWASRADVHRAWSPHSGLEAERMALHDLAHDVRLHAIAEVLIRARGW